MFLSLFTLLADPITNPQIDASISTMTPTGFIDYLLPIIINIFFVVGAIVFVFMLIWGGFTFMTSQGEAGAKAEAQQKITNSVVGLGILFSVYLIIGILNWFFNIDIGLGININPGSAFANLTNPDAQSTISSSIELIFVISSITFLFMFLYGGFLYISSGGDPGALEKAKKVIQNALVGLTIVFSVFFVGYLVNNYFNTNI